MNRRKRYTPDSPGTGCTAGVGAPGVLSLPMYYVEINQSCKVVRLKLIGLQGSQGGSIAPWAQGLHLPMISHYEGLIRSSLA